MLLLCEMDYYEKMKRILDLTELSFDILDSVSPNRTPHNSEAFFKGALAELRKEQPDYISAQVMYSQAIRLVQSQPQPNFPSGGISYEGHKNNNPLS